MERARVDHLEIRDDGDDLMIALEPEAARLFQQLLPIAGDDDAHGNAAAHLCAVLMAPIEDACRIALDDGDTPGYSSLLNVDLCDDLPWLGQFNGTPLTGKESDEEARRMIREARGSHRGKVSALVSDLKATLSGTKSVIVVERDGAPYKNRFIVREDEVIDEHASLVAITNRATKPLGTINTLQVGKATIWADATRKWSTVASGVTWKSVTAEQI